MDDLSDQEKLAKRFLRWAVFWRSFLFWMSFPFGTLLSYLFQPAYLKNLMNVWQYMSIGWAYALYAVLSLFGCRGSSSSGYNRPMSHDELMTVGLILIVITLIVVVIFSMIGSRLVRSAKRTISLVLPNEKVTEITERVEQGLLYMKKDSDTLAGSVKRQLKQFLLGLGIVAGIIVAVLAVVFIGILIIR